MSKDAIWQAFSDTGDPMYYLLYKSTREHERQTKNAEDDTAQGQSPQAGD